MKSAELKAFHSSVSNEWFTPGHIIEAARKAMGGIDLDPATSWDGNRLEVKARNFFDVEMDGLTRDWYGRVWLNPPYGRSGGISNAALWSRKLILQLDQGKVSCACLLVKGAPSERWFGPLFRPDFTICFPYGRLSFMTEEGVAIKGNAHGSAIIGMGVNRKRFIDAFKKIGAIVVPVNVE